MSKIKMHAIILLDLESTADNLIQASAFVSSKYTDWFKVTNATLSDIRKKQHKLIPKMSDNELRTFIYNSDGTFMRTSSRTTLINKTKKILKKILKEGLYDEGIYEE